MTDSFIGVISDTHGLLRPQAIAALKGADMILHAGDVGNSRILAELGTIAPVIAVRGNIDKGEWAQELPEWEVVEVGAVSIYMLHDANALDLKPEAAGFRVVISGHSHQPSAREHKGVLYLNPGSAGARRFSLPVSLAHLKIKGARVEAQLIQLAVRSLNSNKFI